MMLCRFGMRAVRIAVLLAVCFTSGIAGAYGGPEVHPFILYTADDVPVIRERLNRDPYRSWYDGEAAKADEILALDVAWDGSALKAKNKAYYAKVLAFAWAFSDSTHLNADEWRIEVLNALYYGMPTGDFSDTFDDDIDVSEAMVFFAEAYDCLAGGGASFVLDGVGDTESTVRGRMRSIRDYMARDEFMLFPSSQRIGNDFLSASWVSTETTDNHHVKLAASLTVLALTIFDESGSASDYDHGLERLVDSLDNLVVTGNGSSPAGGWAEGPNYHQYAAHQYLAAAQAIENLGAGDLYTDVAGLTETHMLLPYMAMPDFYMPPWDDNEAVRFDLAGLLASHHAGHRGADFLRWMWTGGGQPVNSAFRADYIAGFDDTAPVYSSPDEWNEPLAAFRPESGFARFRSSWDSDAVYLLLQSEHGAAHEKGRGHEHPDQNGILMHAYGEMLLLDSGYGGWSEHDKTRYGVNHNIVLVNGEGPPAAEQAGLLGTWSIAGAGATIVDSLATDMLSFASSQAMYENTLFTRRVMFTDRRFAFMFDTLEAGAESDFTMLLHGNGGGSSGGTFARTSTGAVWNRDNAGLTVGVVTSSDSWMESEDMYHAVYSRSPMETHTGLKVGQRGAEETYLTALYPFPRDGDMPEMTYADVSGGAGLIVHAPEGVDAAVFAGDTGPVTILDADAAGQCDGNYYQLSLDGDGGLERLFFIDGTYAEVKAERRITASVPVMLAVDYVSTDGHVTGAVGANEQVTLTFPGLRAKAAVYNGAGHTITVEGEDSVITVNGRGAFDITLEPEAVSLEPPLNITADDVPDDHGHAIALAWELSPSEDGGLVDWYRIYRSRSEDFNEPKPLDSFDSVEAMNAWDAHATVLIDSVTAGVNAYEDRAVPLAGVNYYYWLQSVGQSGVSRVAISDAEVAVGDRPRAFIIEPPFPNPFNAAVSIRYRLLDDCRVTLHIYDITGRRIATPVDAFQRAGSEHAAVWNGRGDDGSIAGSGVYVYRLNAGGMHYSGRMVFMK